MLSRATAIAAWPKAYPAVFGRDIVINEDAKVSFVERNHVRSRGFDKSCACLVAVAVGLLLMAGSPRMAHFRYAGLVSNFCHGLCHSKRGL
jgi:hypothetical protein